MGYLFSHGLPSLFSASKSKLITEWDGEPVYNPYSLTTHDVNWMEIDANKKAKNYFEDKYGINWNTNKYPIENPFEK